MRLDIQQKYQKDKNMKIDIKKIIKKYYQQTHNFQCLYLDEESYNDFIKRVGNKNSLYLVAIDDEDVVGVCYGRPSKNLENSFELQGIAVNLDEDGKYARKGIGSQLVKKFGKEVNKKGFKKIDVGSADDPKVEKFYLKNGFNPYEIQAKDKNYQIQKKQKIKSYEEGLVIKENLRKKYKPKEVIFIMKKEI